LKYKEKDKNLKAVLALCFTKAEETYKQRHPTQRVKGFAFITDWQLNLEAFR